MNLDRILPLHCRVRAADTCAHVLQDRRSRSTVDKYTVDVSARLNAGHEGKIFQAQRVERTATVQVELRIACVKSGNIIAMSNLHVSQTGKGFFIVMVALSKS